MRGYIWSTKMRRPIDVYVYIRIKNAVFVAAVRRVEGIEIMEGEK